ncbi:hypothetical protein FNW25_06245 [Flavobacterium franklandianum]|uniref:O-antigen ligase domain-containing protein n=1 Tax=Flavobacterium bomense TaxID=2497483 RepID=A0A432CBX6_9FLAO|nr:MULTISPECIES: hypothetical protein [Flavobacterium]RTY98479.1 hypothetical protein EKL98_15700 [Flavobacterium bomense]TRX27567.1 hypothetical protein FNW25_06245 [Flavobacterium franklandianum]
MNTVSDQAVFPNYNAIKTAIWLYFFLWIFEGALRKWILPSLATPLLIVRDPIAVYIIIKALNLNVKFLNPYVVLSAIFTLLGLVVTLTFGHGNLFVGLYGARIMMLHFPLIFIIGSVFSKEDVLKLGRAMLVVNILITLIVYFQFSSPQSAFINIGIGGEGSAGFSGAMGYFRPSGTFSFTAGLSIFYSAISVFIFYFWLSKSPCSKVLLLVSTITLVIAMPLTISRGAVVSVLIVGLFAIMASVTSFKMMFKIVFVCVVFYFTILILQQYSTLFNLSSEVFMHRVDAANKNTSGGGLKDSILLRMLNDFMQPIVDLFNQPLFAGNLGMGTNAGAQMLSGKVVFLIGETEFSRVAGEQGIIFGGGLIILRLFLAASIAFQSWNLPKEEKLLPFIICGAACAAIAQGQWAQPSILGYGISMAGLVLASMNNIETPSEKSIL